MTKGINSELETRCMCTYEYVWISFVRCVVENPMNRLRGQKEWYNCENTEANSCAVYSTNSSTWIEIAMLICLVSVGSRFNYSSIEIQQRRTKCGEMTLMNKFEYSFKIQSKHRLIREHLHLFRANRKGCMSLRISIDDYLFAVYYKTWSKLSRVFDQKTLIGWATSWAKLNSQ